MKRFNTTGPCFPDEHYMMPALDRLPGVRGLRARGGYVVDMKWRDGRVVERHIGGGGKVDANAELYRVAPSSPTE